MSKQVEFPARWQSAFQDLIGLLADGEGTADMFCRVLTAVDEDVISLEIPRSASRCACLAVSTQCDPTWFLLIVQGITLQHLGIFVVV